MDREESLFRKMQEGDWEAFSYFFETYSERLFHYALGFVRVKEEAEDIVQDAFVYLWTHRDKVEWRGSVYAYLSKMVKHACIDFKTREEVKARYEREMMQGEDGEIGRGDGDEDDFEALYARLQKVMEAMPPRCREVFVMGCVDGLSYREIAERMGTSVNTVKTQMQVARQRVKDEFGDRCKRFVWLLFAFVP